jgi:3-methyladenine DNA glycosylase AlkD
MMMTVRKAEIEETSYLEVKRLAAEFDREMHALPTHNTPYERALLKKYAQLVRESPPEFIMSLGRELFGTYGYRWQAYELIRGHKGAFRRIGPAELEEFGRGIDSWWTVDSFARTLAGPAWTRGQAPDELFQSWARSPDLWWRRAALVSTVAWNIRTRGGKGDVPRTLAISRMLANDHDDMVEKAMSWALRELVVHDPGTVRTFLSEYEAELGARVKREVRHKLDTGLKNPRRKK